LYLIVLVHASIVDSMLTFEWVPRYPFEIDTGIRTALFHVCDTSSHRVCTELYVQYFDNCLMSDKKQDLFDL